MLDNFLKYCTLDNPVFLHGLFWGVLFLVTFGFVVNYHLEDARERAIIDQLLSDYTNQQTSNVDGPNIETLKEIKKVKENLPKHDRLTMSNENKQNTDQKKDEC